MCTTRVVGYFEILPDINGILYCFALRFQPLCKRVTTVCKHCRHPNHNAAQGGTMAVTNLSSLTTVNSYGSLFRVNHSLRNVCIGLHDLEETGMFNPKHVSRSAARATGPD